MNNYTGNKAEKVQHLGLRDTVVQFTSCGKKANLYYNPSLNKWQFY